MSEEKQKSVEVKALQIEIEELKVQIIKLSTVKELLQSEKHLRDECEKRLEQAEGVIDKITLWAAGFATSPNSEFKGSWLADEIIKVLQPKKEKKNGKNSK